MCTRFLFTSRWSRVGRHWFPTYESWHLCHYSYTNTLQVSSIREERPPRSPTRYCYNNTNNDSTKNSSYDETSSKFHRNIRPELFQLAIWTGFVPSPTWLQWVLKSTVKTYPPGHLNVAKRRCLLVKVV